MSEALFAWHPDADDHRNGHHANHSTANPFDGDPQYVVILIQQSLSATFLGDGQRQNVEDVWIGLSAASTNGWEFGYAWPAHMAVFRGQRLFVVAQYIQGAGKGGWANGEAALKPGTRGLLTDLEQVDAEGLIKGAR